MKGYNTSNYTIELKGLTFRAFHGALPHENSVGNQFEVALTLHLRECTAMESDSLNETVNYAEAYQLIAQEMRTPSQLIEHVAGRILKQIGQHFPLVASAVVSITKFTPPIPQFNGAGVTFTAQAHY